MDMLDHIKGLKGRGKLRRRGVRGEDAPLPKGEPPDPKVLVAQLGEAEIQKRQGGKVILRRTHHRLKSKKTTDSEFATLALGKGVKVNDLLFLDTETTGLAGGTGTVAFMIGVAQWEGDQLVVEQGFMPEHADEPALLDWLGERVANAKGLVTFNGKTFDLPLLKTRWKMQGQRDALEMPHLDLLPAVRRIYSHRLRTCSLENVERFLLADAREDDLPGKAAPKAYFKYLDGHEIETMVGVFEHNEVDLVSTARLLSMIAALRKSPDTEGREHPRDWLGLGEWLESLDDHEGAIEALRLALATMQSTPQRTKTEMNLADILRKQGKSDEAVVLWRDVATRDPLAGWPAVRALALHHERLQQWTQAREVLDLAWNRFEQVVEMGATLGRNSLPKAWRQWLSECERRRKDLQQAAQEQQLSLF